MANMRQSVEKLDWVLLLSSALLSYSKGGFGPFGSIAPEKMLKIYIQCGAL